MGCGLQPRSRTCWRSSSSAGRSFRLFLAEPLWVCDGAVKLVSGFVKFKLACFRGLRRFCQKRCNLGGVHRLKTARGVQGLLKDRERIATCDDDTRGKIHRVVQTLDRCSRLAPENEMVAHGFHAE